MAHAEEDMITLTVPAACVVAAAGGHAAHNRLMSLQQKVESLEQRIEELELRDTSERKVDKVSKSVKKVAAKPDINSDTVPKGAWKGLPPFTPVAPYEKATPETAVPVADYAGIARNIAVVVFGRDTLGKSSPSAIGHYPQLDPRQMKFIRDKVEEVYLMKVGGQYSEEFTAIWDACIKSIGSKCGELRSPHKCVNKRELIKKRWP